MNYQVKISRSQLIQVLDILEYLEENNDRNRSDSVLYQKLSDILDQDAAAWERGREEARREIDVDQQLAEYQVAVFDMLDEAMADGS